MGVNIANVERIQHRNPGVASDWRLRFHFGDRGIDEESPRVTDAVHAWLCEARSFPDFEARVAQSAWAPFWDALPKDVRVAAFELCTGT